MSENIGGLVRGDRAVGGACENVSGAVGACDSVVCGGCSAVGENNGENGGNLVDCFVPKGTRNDGKSVDTSFFVRKNSQ